MHQIVCATNCSRSHQSRSELTSPEDVDREAGGGALGDSSARSRALFDRRGSDPDTAHAAPAHSRHTGRLKSCMPSKSNRDSHPGMAQTASACK